MAERLEFHLLRLIPHLIFMSGWAVFGRAGTIRYRLDCLVVVVAGRVLLPWRRPICEVSRQAKAFALVLVLGGRMSRGG